MDCHEIERLDAMYGQLKALAEKCAELREKLAISERRDEARAEASAARMCASDWKIKAQSLQNTLNTEREKNARLREALEEFRPTPDCVNRLPRRIREYIHDLETRCDPAGDIQALACLRENVSALGVENARLREALEACREFRDTAPAILGGRFYQEKMRERSALEKRKNELMDAALATTPEPTKHPDTERMDRLSRVISNGTTQLSIRVEHRKVCIHYFRNGRWNTARGNTLRAAIDGIEGGAIVSDRAK